MWSLNAAIVMGDDTVVEEGAAVVAEEAYMGPGGGEEADAEGDEPVEDGDTCDAGDDVPANEAGAIVMIMVKMQVMM